MKYLKRYEEALACYDMALGIKPDLSDAWFNKSLVNHEIGDLEQELYCLDKALELNSFHPQAREAKQAIMARLSGT